MAWATIISQLISAVLTVWALMTCDDIYRLELKKLKIDFRMMKRILNMGIRAAYSSRLLSSNVIVQAM